MLTDGKINKILAEEFYVKMKGIPKDHDGFLKAFKSLYRKASLLKNAKNMPRSVYFCKVSEGRTLVEFVDFEWVGYDEL